MNSRVLFGFTFWESELDLICARAMYKYRCIWIKETRYLRVLRYYLVSKVRSF